MDSAAPLATLPPELHHLILLHSLPPLALNTPTVHATSVSQFRATLRSYSLISPLFAKWCQKLLFESIHIDSAERMERLLGSLKVLEEREKGRGVKVRRLRFGSVKGDGWTFKEADRKTFEELLEVLGAELEELRMVRCWYIGLKELSKARTLEKLFVLNCTFASPTVALSSNSLTPPEPPLVLPNLRHLYLTEVCLPHPITETLLTPTCFPSLTSLSFALNRSITIRPTQVHVFPGGLPVPVLLTNRRSLSLSSAINGEAGKLFLRSLRGLSTTDNSLEANLGDDLDKLEVLDCWGHLLLLDERKMVDRIPKTVKKLRLNFGGRAPQSLPEELREPLPPPFVGRAPPPGGPGAGGEQVDNEWTEGEMKNLGKVPWIVTLASSMHNWLCPSGALSHIDQLVIPSDWIQDGTGWEEVLEKFGGGRVLLEDRSIDDAREWRDEGWGEDEATWWRMEESCWDRGFWKLVEEVERE